jgi:hypothetical protein
MRPIAVILLALSVGGCGSREVGQGGDPKQTLAPRTEPSNINPTPPIRIIVVDDITLYIPVEWLRGYFADGSKAWAHIVSGKFVPDIGRVERPGLVHRFSVGERTSLYGAMSFNISGSPPKALRVNSTLLHQLPTVLIKARSINSETLSSYAPETNSSNRWERSQTAPMTYSVRRAGIPKWKHCAAQAGTPASEWVLSRWVTPTVGIGVVIKANASEPSLEWVPLCDALIPLFDALQKRPLAS